MYGRDKFCANSEEGCENLEIYDENKEAEFDYDWLYRQDYQFKILALLAVLADNHLRMSLPKQRFVPFLAGMRKIYPETACMVVID